MASGITDGVLTTLEYLEISENMLILESSGNLKFSHGIFLYIRRYFAV